MLPLHEAFPQLAPLGLALESRQARAPVEHDVIPFMHSGDGLSVHPSPAVQPTQVAAPLQTALVPQTVPTGLALPSRHWAAPEVQETTPFRHRFGFVVHDAPEAHAMQPPTPLQTWLVPQLVPAALLPESTHVRLPVAQLDVPVLHTDGLVEHAWPAVHAAQVPVEVQTWLVPQLVPGAFTAPFTHTAAPVLHETTPR